MKLLAALQKKRDIGIVFISHDLAVVADIADTIVVMQEGKVVESGNRDEIFRNAKQPYTQKLLQAIPTGGKAGRVTNVGAADGNSPPVDLVSVREKRRSKP